MAEAMMAIANDDDVKLEEVEMKEPEPGNLFTIDGILIFICFML
jgi:hypothetical protein